MPLAVAILACLAVATAFGFLNGVIITKAKLPPFIVTLAIGIMARSITMYFCRGATIMGNNIPPFTQIGNGSLFGIVPYPFIVAMVIAVAFHIILTRYEVRHVRVRGRRQPERGDVLGHQGRPDQDRHLHDRGPVHGRGGDAGDVAHGRGRGGQLGQPVRVRGHHRGHRRAAPSLAGGRGRIVGTIVGFIILGIVNNMMIMLNISPYLSGAVKGAVILFAVLMQRRERY